jgi:hypothetical protein
MVAAWFGRTSLSPTSTNATSFSASGTWEGQYEVTRCDTNASDARNCVHNRKGVVRLKLTQQADEVSGSLSLSPRAEVVISVPVSGRALEQTITLEGLGSTEGGLRRFVENWNATVWGAGRMIQATFDERTEQPGFCYSIRWCIDPIVWRRSYSTSPMIRVNE